MAALDRPRDRTTALLLGAQGLTLLLAVFVPFGFDRPSSLGLSFGHFLLVAALYLAALLAGLVRAVVRRRWWLLAGELALPGVLGALVLTGSLAL